VNEGSEGEAKKWKTRPSSGAPSTTTGTAQVGLSKKNPEGEQEAAGKAKPT
jgi:hypothetical protein